MISMAIVLTCIILCVLSLIMSGIAIIMVLALKNSTHKIEWKNPFADEEGFLPMGSLNEALKKKNQELEDDLV